MRKKTTALPFSRHGKIATAAGWQPQGQRRTLTVSNSSIAEKRWDPAMTQFGSTEAGEIESSPAASNAPRSLSERLIQSVRVSANIACPSGN